MNFVQVPISISPLHPLAGKLVSWLIPLSLIPFSYIWLSQILSFFILRKPIPELAIGLNPTFVQFQSSFESLHLHRISALSAVLALLNSDIYHIILLVSGGSQGSIPLTSGEGFWQYRDFSWLSITPEPVIRREKREKRKRNGKGKKRKERRKEPNEERRE